MSTKKRIVIKGIVVAAAWGADGEIAAVDIAGYDERRYRVANDHKGQQLREWNKKTVVVHGRLGTEGRKNLLYVDRFNAEDADPWPVASGDGTAA